MKVWTGSQVNHFDVVIVGSGAAGLTAALAAAHRGASVAVLEKADYLGGTSAVSGGMIWIPINRCMAAMGLTDSRADALEYLDAVCDHLGGDVGDGPGEHGLADLRALHEAYDEVRMH